MLAKSNKRKAHKIHIQKDEQASKVDNITPLCNERDGKVDKNFFLWTGMQ